jgi:hypothetical protein
LARLPAGLPGAASASSRAAKALTAFIASARGPGSAHRARSTAHAPTRVRRKRGASWQLYRLSFAAFFPSSRADHGLAPRGREAGWRISTRVHAA